MTIIVSKLIKFDHRDSVEHKHKCFLILSKHPCNALQAIDVSRCNCVSSSGLISVISEHDGLQQMGAAHCLSVSLYLTFFFCVLLYIVA